MAGGWYYAHEGSKIGPVSGEHLKELAASGAVLPTDTVWKAGVEAGVFANRIKNLFAPFSADAGANAPAAADASAAPTPIGPRSGDRPSHGEGEPSPVAVLPETKNAQPKVPPRVKKGSATALKGADIVGLDGMYARYRMKCSECGHKDSSCRTIQISNKMTKTGFFCPKCRKRREVVIQCRLG